MQLEDWTMPAKKAEIITFKVSPDMLDALEGVPNRSEFIRNALLAALDGTCPLCGGTGQLSPSQRQHWGRFAESHQVTECDDCHELHLVCSNEGPSRRKVQR